ncbi:hydrolase [Bacteroidota bacterium]|nr:hydrolase [Bacteroidota bacterium]
MKITFLGTGTSQGVPVISCSCRVCTSTNNKDNRLRSSIMIEHEEKVFVIDSGPDFRQQMLRENVKRLDALIFTHSHKDHTAGMDDIRAFNFFMQKPMEVYATDFTQQKLREEFPYIFNKSDYPGIPELNFHSINGDTNFFIEGLEIIPIKVLHYKMPVLGFRFGNFTYITDANQIPAEEKKKIQGSKILVLNALQMEPHISHFTLAEAIEVAKELNAETTYFTHISHRLGLDDEVSLNLPIGVHLSYDGLQLIL